MYIYIYEIERERERDMYDIVLKPPGGRQRHGARPAALLDLRGHPEEV